MKAGTGSTEVESNAARPATARSATPIERTRHVQATIVISTRRLVGAEAGPKNVTGL